MTMTVEQAKAEVERYKQAIADLEARAEELRRQAEETKALRAQAVLEQAVGGGSQKAVSEAAKAAAAVAVELESNAVALEEARRMLQQAENRLKLAKQAEASKAFKALAEQRREAAKEIDALLDRLAEAMARYYEIDRKQYQEARAADLSFNWIAKPMLTDVVAYRLGGYKPGSGEGFIDVAGPPARRGNLVDMDPYAKPETIQVEVSKDA